REVLAAWANRDDESAENAGDPRATDVPVAGGN
ncbi:MAG: hypothetical protein RLZ29_936, partial [Actinomycetota bacterium]